MSKQIQDLVTDAEQLIQEHIDYCLTNADDHTIESLIDECEDVRHEIIDGLIPVYYRDLAEYLANDTSLAEVDDSGLLPENPSVWQIIQISMFEQISNELDIETLVNEYVTEHECDDDCDDDCEITLDRVA